MAHRAQVPIDEDTEERAEALAKARGLTLPKLYALLLYRALIERPEVGDKLLSENVTPSRLETTSRSR